jgi:hypothetical protein
VPNVYEFGITGAVGPVIQACLPETSVVTETHFTVLTGTVDGPDQLRRVLDLLDDNGVPALDLRISRHQAG